MAQRAASPLQPQDAAQTLADHRLAAAVQLGAGARRPDRRRDGGPDCDPAVAGVLEHCGAAAAARAVRLVPRVLRVHGAGRVPRRARRAHRHRLAAHLPGGGRRAAQGGVAHLPVGRRHAADGRARPRLPHQLRVGPGLLGLHVRRGAHDRHVTGQGPVPHHGDWLHVPAAVDLHLPEPALGCALGPGARLRLYRYAAHHAETRYDQAGCRCGRRSQHAAEGDRQVPVAGEHVPERHRGGGDRPARLLVHRLAGGVPRQPYGRDPERRTGATAATVQLRARRQHDRRLRGHGVGAGLGPARDPADCAARGHRHLQSVLRRAHHRRDAGDGRAGRGRARQLVHAGVPGRRVAGALRRLQRLRRPHHLQRRLHRSHGDPGAAVLHAVLRVHPEGGAGGRHHLRHPVHGRVQRHQAHVACQEVGPDPGRGHVRAVPDAAHRAGHPHRRHREHHLHPVPRRAPQAHRRAAQDGARRRVPDGDAGPLPHVPVGGVRAAAGDQVRGGRRAARGAGVHAHLLGRLHGGAEHPAADGRLPPPPPAALLLQREALRVLHLRGGRQAGALRRLLRGRGARPAARRRRAAARQAAARALGSVSSVFSVSSRSRDISLFGAPLNSFYQVVLL